MSIWSSFLGLSDSCALCKGTIAQSLIDTMLNTYTRQFSSSGAQCLVTTHICVPHRSTILRSLWGLPPPQVFAPPSSPRPRGACSFLQPVTIFSVSWTVLRLSTSSPIKASCIFSLFFSPHRRSLAAGKRKRNCMYGSSTNNDSPVYAAEGRRAADQGLH